MAANSRVDLVCENTNRNGQRVSVNLSEQTVTFFNCHQLRSGLGVGLSLSESVLLRKSSRFMIFWSASIEGSSCESFS